MIWMPNHFYLKVDQRSFLSSAHEFQIHSRWRSYNLSNKVLSSCWRVESLALMDLHFEVKLVHGITCSIIITILVPKHIKVSILDSTQFLVTLLCKDRNELTLYLTFMGVSIGVLFLSSCPWYIVNCLCLILVSRH